MSLVIVRCAPGNVAFDDTEPKKCDQQRVVLRPGSFCYRRVRVDHLASGRRLPGARSEPEAPEEAARLPGAGAA